MNKTVSILLALLAVLMIGCGDDENVTVDPVPATPQGVYSVTGDEVVWIYWNGIYESDVKEYVVYRSAQETTGFQAIGTVAAEDNPNLNLLIYEYPDGAVTNGATYYYAVTAVDHAGQESDLSAENVYDTPRNEGQASIFPWEVDSTLAGFNLETARNVHFRSAAADVWIDTDPIDDNVRYLNAGSVDVNIQDFGYTSSFDDVSYAPDTGWSQLGYVEIILGHTYVIWTADNHFAKMRAVSFNGSGSITFEWAWQNDAGNPELAPGIRKPMHREGYLKARPGDVAADAISEVR
jgi:hypothetical protein